MNFNPKEFSDNYELVNTSDSFRPKGVHPKTCRYCGNTEPAVSFIQKTHLIPEFLGRNNSLTYNECDSCNNLFSKYESHFAEFVRPILPLVGVRGKKKISTFQSRPKNKGEEGYSTIKHSKDGTRHIFMQSMKDVTFDDKNNIAEFTFESNPIVALNVYKSLVKIGLSLLPENYDSYYSEVFKWITERRFDGKILFFPILISYMFQNKKCVEPFASLYRAKKIMDDQRIYLEYSLILTFANQIFQIYLPLSDEIKMRDPGGKSCDLIIYPSFIHDLKAGENHITLKLTDLESDAPIEMDQKIQLAYDSHIKNIS